MPGSMGIMDSMSCNWSRKPKAPPAWYSPARPHIRPASACAGSHRPNIWSQTASPVSGAMREVRSSHFSRVRSRRACPAPQVARISRQPSRRGDHPTRNCTVTEPPGGSANCVRRPSAGSISRFSGAWPSSVKSAAKPCPSIEPEAMIIGGSGKARVSRASSTLTPINQSTEAVNRSERARPPELRMVTSRHFAGRSTSTNCSTVHISVPAPDENRLMPGRCSTRKGWARPRCSGRSEA